MTTTFKTIHKHKPGTEIEVFGEYFTFSTDAWSFGLLNTENPLVIDRLRGIPEGFKELPHAMPPLNESLAVAKIAQLSGPVASAIEQLQQISAEAAALNATTSANPEAAPAPAPAPAEAPAIVSGPVPAPATEPPAPPPAPAPTPPAFVLRNEATGDELNLSAMDDAALRQFVLDNKLTVPSTAKKGDKLRQAIVEALTKPAA